MALRCLLFTSEAGTAEPICQALTALGVEGEHCADPVGAIDRVTQQQFQIVIIDWDQQPEAVMVLTASRERKASQRPLTLAIVSEDIDVPKALQAGANSILRRPILMNQVKDTLTTARDLLKAKEFAAQAVAAGTSPSASPAPATIPASIAAGDENKKNLRAGEFLQSSGPRPSGEFLVEESGVPDFSGQASSPIDPLMELEPTAAPVAQSKPLQTKQAPPENPAPPLPAVPPPAPGDEPRGLDWYLKRAGLGPSAAAPAPAREAAPPETSKPDLMGFDQAPTPSYSAPAHSASTGSSIEESPSAAERPIASEKKAEKKAEDRLFAYIDGESSESEAQPKARFRLGKGAIVLASLLAACAIIAAPQAPWHPKAVAAWARGQRSLHAWLNPQVVTNTQQAPESHESFARAGDEYKLPVAETIPDATTDPSQIKVVPVIDPTAKKPNNGTTDQGGQTVDSTGQPADPAATGTSNPSPTDQSVGSTANGTQPASGTTTPSTPQESTQPSSAQPLAPTSTPSSSTPISSPPVTPNSTPVQAHPNTPAVPSSLLSPRPADPAGPKVEVPQAGPNASVAGPSNVPSSLKSQIASMTPDASGNKAPEAALPSIEPVALSEAVERQLLTDQPAIGAPASVKGQQGTVILQVLIGRDGTVQDAKFLQGSLAFARAAIDGVKQWKFKPYNMNGRPVSVQTTMTMSFKASN